MKKLLNNPFLRRTSVFSLVCSLMLCNAVYAQTCSDGVCTGDVTLDSLEAITEDIRNARRIVGDLTIGDGEAGNDITNTELARLQVQEITGDLLIQATKLTSLTAFSALRRVGGDFYIGGSSASHINTMLESISGFNALEHIGGELARARKYYADYCHWFRET